MKSFLLIIIVSFGLWSCASKQVVEPTPLQYSEETIRAFEEIEREQVLEYYRQLRERERTGQHRTPPPATPEALQRYQTQTPPAVSPRPAPRPSPPSAPSASRSGVIQADPEELAREIDQNMSFFCMRTRNEPRFSEEGSCENFTEKAERECREQFEQNDRRLFNCIRGRLQ